MKSFLVVILLAVVVYILPLNVRPMSIPDESRYAEIPREMIASGDWVVPHLNGLRYFEKPVLGYWINAVSILVFGENNFAIRFPSALAALLSATLIFLLVGKFTGDGRKGALTAAALLTCAEVFAVGVFNVLDSMFSLFLTGMMTCFFFAVNEPRDRRRNILLAACGAFCGLAFLTKGFLAFALPVAGILPYLIWEKRIKELFKLAWIPALSAILVILPWAIMIHVHEKDYWIQFFWVEHIRRFFNPMGKAQHEEPFWYFLPILAGGIFPWLFVAPAALRGIFQKGFANPLNRFATCWFLFFFLFFSASTGKLGTYILPCFPPLMILFVDGLLKYLEKERTRLFSAGALLAAIVMAGASLYLLISQTSPALEHLKAYWDDESWKWKMLAVGIAVSSIFAFLATRKTGSYRQVACFSIIPILLFFTIHFAVPQAFRLKSRECMDPAGMIRHNMERIKPGSIVVSENYLVHAACWVLKRDDLYLIENGGELDYGLGYPDAKGRLIQPEDIQCFKNRSKEPATLITEFRDYARWESQLPKPFFILNTNGFVFAQYNLADEQKK